MEQINQPRGDTSEINTEPIPASAPAPPTEVPIYQAEPPDQRPPLTFWEAEAHNPFALLTELHDHALARRVHGEPPTFHLTELALSAAVVAWWSRWQPISMHRAFLAGADLADVAKAIGTTQADAYQRWSAWADVQAKLIIAGRAGVDATEVAAIRRRLGQAQPDGC